MHTSVLLFPALLTTVLTLECYVTDLLAIGARSLNAKPVLQKCETFNNLQNNWQCFTVVADSDRATVNLQGCTTEDDCQVLKNEVVQTISRISHRYHSFKCRLCASDVCNAEVTRSIVIKIVKNWVNVQQVIIITVVVTLVVSVAFMLFCFLRNRSASYSQMRY